MAFQIGFLQQVHYLFVKLHENLSNVIFLLKNSVAFCWKKVFPARIFGEAKNIVIGSFCFVIMKKIQMNIKH